MKEQSFSTLEVSPSFSTEIPLASHLNTFVSILIEQGYSKASMDRKQWLIGKLSQWFSQQSLRIEELNEQKMDQFIEFQGVKGATRQGDRATLRSLLQYLENLGIILSSPEETEDNPI